MDDGGSQDFFQTITSIDTAGAATITSICQNGGDLSPLLDMEVY